MRLASPTLARAAREYRWLLDRDYSAAAALKLVGDHHQMTRDERMILFRGVSSKLDSETRAIILASPSSVRTGREILVDGYNQALTVMHYLAGRPLFIGTDGLTRDAGAAHGRIADRERFERSIGLLADSLAALSPERVAVYLDAPVPGSAGHASIFRRTLEERGISAIVLLEKSADAPLKAAGSLANGGSLVATGDSAIADALTGARTGGRAMLYDAARWAIELAFGPVDLLDLGRLVEEPNEAL
jgi:hypothetical protein